MQTKEEYHKTHIHNHATCMKITLPTQESIFHCILITVIYVYSFLIFLVFGFWACYATTMLSLQSHQKRIQVVCNLMVVRRISNGTPAMDLGLEGIRTHI